MNKENGAGGPTALILGAGSDMAAAIAKKLASAGWNIQLAARNMQRLDLMEKDCRIRYNVNCTLHEFDALRFETHESFFNELSPKPGLVVCVFGYMGENEAVRKSWKETARTIHTNYTGAVSILNIVADYYEQEKQGTIVGISSVAGERGRQSNYIYGSAKAGFTAYLSGLRNRLFRENVHVISVLPGFVYTRMTETLSLPKLLTAQPSEVADAVYKAVVGKKNTVYIKWFWRWIMLIIKCIPESIFKKLKL